MALKLRRADKRFIPQSTRAASFKRLLGSSLASSVMLKPRPKSGHGEGPKHYGRGTRHDQRRNERRKQREKEECKEAYSEPAKTLHAVSSYDLSDAEGQGYQVSEGKPCNEVGSVAWLVGPGEITRGQSERRAADDDEE